MEKRAAGLAAAVDQLLRSGFQGQARPGDTIGIWTYNDTLTAGEFPLQTWSKDAGKRISTGMLAFLADQKLQKQPRFNSVLPALEPVVKHSPFLTVVVICSGSDPVKGTPFDKEISKQLAAWRADAQKSRMPIVVALRATHGLFTHYSVTPAPWQIDMPPFPSELVAAPPAPKPAAVVLPPTPPVAAPLIVVGKHKPPPPAIDAEPTNSIPSPSVAGLIPDSLDSTNLAGRVTQRGPSPGPSSPDLPSTASATRTNSSPAATQTETALQTSSDLIVHAREVTPMAAAPIARPNSFSIILKRSLIAAGVLALVSLLFILPRSRQNHTSLITHSINRNR